MLDNRIIFLISQPRAGSTLMQKIIGKHPDIFTMSEPWILLYPFSIFRHEDYHADYDSHFCQIGITDFFTLVEGGKEKYFELLANLHKELYFQISGMHGKKFFLDKTPRYYNIIPELDKSFPDANFILLFRNPLAVLCSIISTWVHDRWLGLYKYRNDLVVAPNLLVQGIDRLGERAIVIQYESMLLNPNQMLRQISEGVNVEFEPNILDYSQDNSMEWSMGDKKKVYKYDKPDISNKDNWLIQLSDPQVWRLANDYLEFLGEETLRRMGYEYSELRQCLNSHYPGRLNLWNTMSLECLIRDPNEYATLNYGYYPLRLASALRRKGLIGSGVELIRKLLDKVSR